jgi:hypothetical protein
MTCVYCSMWRDRYLPLVSKGLIVRYLTNKATKPDAFLSSVDLLLFYSLTNSANQLVLFRRLSDKRCYLSKCIQPVCVPRVIPISCIYSLSLHLSIDVFLCRWYTPVPICLKINAGSVIHVASLQLWPKSLRLNRLSWCGSSQILSVMLTLFTWHERSVELNQNKNCLQVLLTAWQTSGIFRTILTNQNYLPEEVEMG